MCLYPRLIENKRYLPNKKNGGRPEAPADKRMRVVPIACGQCIECRKQKAREWQARLCEELRDDPGALFMTMTFSNESLRRFKDEYGIDEANETAAKAIELFQKRWYKQYKCSIKHWLVTELGHGTRGKPGTKSTERLHLHGFLWTDKECAEIEKVWAYGWVDTGEYVNEQSIGYCVKYVSKTDAAHPGFVSRVFASKGLGKGFLRRSDAIYNRFKGEDTREYYRTKSGLKIGIPTYWRNKLWTEEERGKLWIQKLDKNVRYVRGMKIDVSTPEGIHEYYEALAREQRINVELGYPKEAWERKKYKNSREKFGISN